MTILSRPVDHTLDGEAFEGLLATDAGTPGKRPAVIVFHAWAGRSDVENGYALKLANLGYAGFAADLYGKGVYGQTTEACQALMTPFMDNRPMLQRRLLGVVDFVKSLAEVDAARVAVMGFCFGGLCALDIARTGAEIRGAASFHGLFAPPGNTTSAKIKARVVAFHGWDDPMATPEDVSSFAREMDGAGADWQLHAYGGVMHAFTNPQANDPAFGTVYNRSAADRSWLAAQAFFAECFA